MTKREKLLASLVGALILLVALGYGFRQIDRTLKARRNQLADVHKQIRDKRRVIRFSHQAADRLKVYERRALPNDLETARSQYQEFLVSLVTNAGFDDPNVVASSSRDVRGVYHQFSFTISGQGDLRQLIDFLYEFYAADYLHRVRRLHAKRIPDTRRLDLSFSIEAVSLPTSENEKLPRPSVDGTMLAFGNRVDYYSTVLGRNLAGPANKEPRLEGLRDRTVTVDESVEFRVAARDPDKLDSVRYSLEGESLADARFDERSGEFRWRPKEVGQYTFVFKATDDGWPARSDTAAVRINVIEPPPEKPAPPTPKREPNFAPARFTFVTAITQAGGRRQAWIDLRSEGELLKLFEGDEFTVGDVNVVVEAINDRYVIIEAKELEKRLVVDLGKALSQGGKL